jgi:hypothetical protein
MAGQAGGAAMAAGDGGDDDSGSYEAPRDLADVGAASEATREREPMPSPVLGTPGSFDASQGDSSRPPQPGAASPAREPASRSFDFDRPAAAPVSTPVTAPVHGAAEPRDVGAPGAASRDTGMPAPVAPPREREPATVATAVEPREWTPTPPTDTPTSRSEP